MATNMYIKFEEPGIEGGSSAAEHAEQIEIMSWSHGFTQPTSPTRATAGGGTVEQANHSNFTFTKYIDSATDDLLKMLERQADQQGHGHLLPRRRRGGQQAGQVPEGRDGAR